MVGRSVISDFATQDELDSITNIKAGTLIASAEIFVSGQEKVHCTDLYVVIIPAEIGNNPFTGAGNPLVPVTVTVPFWLSVSAAPGRFSSIIRKAS